MIKYTLCKGGFKKGNSFKYEILSHDYASTDKTVEILNKKRLIIILDYYTPKLSQLLRVVIKRVKVWRMT